MTVVAKITAECGAGHAVKLQIVGLPGDPHTEQVLADGESAKVSLYSTRRIVITEVDVEVAPDLAKAENAAPTGDAPQPE